MENNLFLTRYHAEKLKLQGKAAPRFIDVWIPKAEEKDYIKNMTKRGWRVLGKSKEYGMKKLILTNAKDDFLKTKRHK